MRTRLKRASEEEIDRQRNRNADCEAAGEQSEGNGGSTASKHAERTQAHEELVCHIRIIRKGVTYCAHRRCQLLHRARPLLKRRCTARVQPNGTADAAERHGP